MNVYQGQVQLRQANDAEHPEIEKQLMGWAKTLVGSIWRWIVSLWIRKEDLPEKECGISQPRSARAFCEQNAFLCREDVLLVDVDSVWYTFCVIVVLKMRERNYEIKNKAIYCACGIRGDHDRNGCKRLGLHGETGKGYHRAVGV